MPAPTEPEVERVEDNEELHGQMSFLDHLEELRSRLIRMLIEVGVAFFACFYFSYGKHAYLVDFVARPLKRLNVEFIFIKPIDAVTLSMKVAFLAAVFVVAPFLMREVWGFISPGLYKRERRWALPFIVGSSFLFVLGGAFG